MKLNMSHTKTEIVSRSCTLHPESTPLILDGTVLKESDDLVMLGVAFGTKMTFETDLCSVSRAAVQRIGMILIVLAIIS